MWSPVRVRGDSMLPVLHEGDLLVVRPARAGDLLLGRIVVARSGGREIVKRVVAVGTNDVALAGDNAEASSDPVPVATGEVTGVVVARYWPPWRIRRFASHETRS